MRVVRAGLLLVALGLAAAVSQPDAVSACSGRTTAFADAVRVSDGAIYTGWITRADIVDTFWIDLTINTNVVIRGPAASQVRRAQASAVCEGIQVGQYGYIVRGVDDPQFPGHNRTDLFFQVGESALTRSEVHAALIAAGLPDTATLDDPPRAMPLIGVPWTWLALLLAAAFVLTSGAIRHRQE